MKKDIIKKIKLLFDYQKFEENPKLNQAIKDSLKEEYSSLTELDLDKVTGGSYIRTAIYCTHCGGHKTLIHLIDTTNNKEYYNCYKCGFSETKDLNN